MRDSHVRFILQQGFPAEGVDEQLYSALMLQPRIIAGVVVLGVLQQSPWIFLGLSAALWWSAIVPTLSPFDAIYNHAVAYRRGFLPLGAAPAPRRFAAGLAATFGLLIAVALFLGAAMTALVLELLLAIGVAAPVFRSFCAGACLYHRVYGWMGIVPFPSTIGGKACTSS